MSLADQLQQLSDEQLREKLAETCKMNTTGSKEEMITKISQLEEFVAENSSSTDESADVIVEAEEVEDEEVQEDEDEKDEKNKSFLEDKNAHYTAPNISDINFAEMTYRDITQEMVFNKRRLRLLAYPITETDLSDILFKNFLQKCSKYSLHCTSSSCENGTIAGCMEMTFSTLKDRQTAEEELPKWKPSLKLAQAKGTSKGIGTLCQELSDDFRISGDPGNRCICVSGFPDTTTESDLLELFHGYMVIIASDPVTDEKKSRAYIEFDTEELTQSAVLKGQGMRIDDHPLDAFLVTKTVQDKPKHFLDVKDVKAKAISIAELRNNLAQNWSSASIATLNAKVEDIQKKEQVLKVDEERKQADHLPSAELWKKYVYDELKKVGVTVEQRHWRVALHSTTNLRDRLEERKLRVDLKQKEAKVKQQKSEKHAQKKKQSPIQHNKQRPRHSAPQMRGCGGGGRVRPQQSHGLLGEAPMTANQASHVLSMLSQLLSEREQRQHHQNGYSSSSPMSSQQQMYGANYQPHNPMYNPYSSGYGSHGRPQQQQRPGGRRRNC